jgi:EmrB/QacA subfamily drug resistance transporter
MANSTRSAGAAPPDKLDKGLLRLAGAIMFGALAVQLDATMVNVAFNTLLRDFHSTLSTIQWVGTAYLLAMAMIIPVTGWSIERFGAKTMWMTAVTVFLIGSILCGIAWSAPSLIIFRVVQGLGGGLILPLAQTILAQAAGPERLGRVMAAIGVPAILGPVLGPVLGGLIISDLSWHWIFYVNVPVCLIGLWYAARVMPSTPRQARSARQKLDVLGLALLSPGIALVVYGLSEAGTKASFDNTSVYGPLAGGLVLLIAFIAHALTTKIEPLMDLRLFRARGYSTSVAVIFLSGLALFGATTLLPLYYQQVRLYTPLHAGVLLIPQGVGLGLSLIIAGDLADKINPRGITIVGLLLAAAGTVVYTQLSPTSNLILLGAGLFVGGAGLGAALVPVLTAALRGMRGPEIARATSSVRIFQQLGASFGIAVLVVILQREYTSHLAAAGGHVTAAVASHAFGSTFWWPFAFALAACIPALFLPPRPKGPSGVEAAAAQNTAPVL